MMNKLQTEHSQSLFRYKGVVAVREDPGGPVLRVVLQGVHDMLRFERRGKWPIDKPYHSQVVLIGKKLDFEAFARMFEEAKEKGEAPLSNLKGRKPATGGYAKEAALFPQTTE